jgi:CRP-like cAMP-binding protein
LLSIARDSPLGADGWEMRVLLPEFSERAHACHDLYLKSAPRGVGGGESRPSQAAFSARFAPPQTDTLKARHPIEHVYFVQQGMVSLVQPLENGAMIEVGMIGNEGFVGVPVLLGAESSPLEAMVQIPGSALRMQASAFREEVTRRSTLLALLLRYVQALHIQVSLSAACNGRHTLPERLARWLLTARDRATSDELPLSHEFLSMMLGVRRAGVTVAVGTLKTAGLIRNSHGRVTIIDRQGLEAASCECYRTVRNEYERLLP